MPTKRRRVVRVQRPELSPAAIYLLTTGRFAESYLPGWANLQWDMTPHAHDPVAWRHAIWTPALGAWLEAEAVAASFQPWALTGRRPRGAAVAAWETTFLAEHGRRP